MFKGIYTLMHVWHFDGWNDWKSKICSTSVNLSSESLTWTNVRTRKTRNLGSKCRKQQINQTLSIVVLDRICSSMRLDIITTCFRYWRPFTSKLYNSLKYIQFCYERSAYIFSATAMTPVALIQPFSIAISSCAWSILNIDLCTSLSSKFLEETIGSISMICSSWFNPINTGTYAM